MNPETQSLLDALAELRQGQREMIALLEANRQLAEQQAERAAYTVQESVALQREAVQRARTIGRIALPGILACIAAIAYLVIRYF